MEKVLFHRHSFIYITNALLSLEIWLFIGLSCNEFRDVFQVLIDCLNSRIQVQVELEPRDCTSNLRNQQHISQTQFISKCKLAMSIGYEGFQSFNKTQSIPLNPLFTRG